MAIEDSEKSASDKDATKYADKKASLNLLEDLSALKAS